MVPSVYTLLINTIYLQSYEHTGSRGNPFQETHVSSTEEIWGGWFQQNPV